MNPKELRTPKPAAAMPGRGALRPALRPPHPRAADPAADDGAGRHLSFNFQVLLPLLAEFTWHGTATTYALLTAAMGVGSVGGALAAGARGRVSPRLWSARRCCSARAAARRGRAHAVAPDPRARAARRRERDLRRGRELVAADRGRARDARAGHGALQRWSSSARRRSARRWSAGSRAPPGPRGAGPGRRGRADRRRRGVGVVRAGGADRPGPRWATSLATGWAARRPR